MSSFQYPHLSVPSMILLCLITHFHGPMLDLTRLPINHLHRDPGSTSHSGHHFLSLQLTFSPVSVVH